MLEHYYKQIFLYDLKHDFNHLEDLQVLICTRQVYEYKYVFSIYYIYRIEIDHVVHNYTLIFCQDYSVDVDVIHFDNDFVVNVFYNFFIIN